jgi:hypothetical protein
MSFLRGFENTSRCMQRLGFVKYLVSRCARTATSSLDSLGKDLVGTVTRKVNAPLTPALYRYIKRRLTDRAYDDLKRRLKGLSEGEQVYIEIQDAYLASSSLPSRTGKLVYEDWRKFPYFLSSLGLMRKGTYSLLVMGHTLLRLVPPEEVAAFREYTPEVNPFLLANKQRLLFLFLFLERDGDVLQPLYARISELPQPFSDREAGDLLPPIFRSLVKRYQERARSADDTTRLQRLLDTAASIERWKGKPYTGMGARQHAVTVRLEPFVDMGLLTKDDPFSYKYALSEVGEAFFARFAQAEDIGAFLESAFFRAVDSAFGFGARHADDDRIFTRFYEGYEQLKSPWGYAPIKDVALLAGIRSLIEDGLYFEIEEAVSLLKALQRERPDVVVFNIDRMGNLVYVKFNDDPLR